MSEKQNKNVTVRVQKIKKNHIKQKLVFFLILAIGLVILAVFSEHLCPYDPYAQDLASALQPPSLQHPMGTETYGRDMLSRVISGARASIFSTFILVAVIFVLGTAVGVCCGYFGGAADTVMMRISDICLAFPGLVFAMAIAAILGGGWQKIKGDYYFFQIRNGCYASMVTSRRVNGIYLTKSGEARYNSEEKRKLNLMVTANQVMRRVTKRNMSKPEKLWRCYLKAVSYGYGGTGNDYDFRYYYSNWDVSYAEDMFYRGHGDCFAFASAFAYLANAVGFEAKVISSGGHGWAEIKGEVCDPNWAKGTGHIERYYRMSYDLSGVDGRPYYRGNRAYVIAI